MYTIKQFNPTCLTMIYSLDTFKASPTTTSPTTCCRNDMYHTTRTDGCQLLNFE